MDNLMQDLLEAQELMGVPILGIPTERQTIIHDDGTFSTRTTVGWIKLSFEFRKRVLRQLKGAKLSVFLCICLHINDSGESWPSVTLISEETGYSRDEITETIRELEAIPGLLDVARTPGKSTVYTPLYASYGDSSPIVYEATSQGKSTGSTSQGNSTTPVRETLTRSRTNKREPIIPLGEKTPAVSNEAETYFIELVMPEGTSRPGEKRYRVSCPECHKADLSIDSLRCPNGNCDIPVRWSGSKVLAERQKAIETELKAAEKRDARYAHLMPGARYLMDEARKREEQALSKPAGASKSELQPPEIKELAYYERTYGEKFIRDIVDGLPGLGRGLMAHAVRTLSHKAENGSKPSIDRQNQWQDPAIRPVVGADGKEYLSF